jgi:hypothetical protein
MCERQAKRAMRGRGIVTQWKMALKIFRLSFHDLLDFCSLTSPLVKIFLSALRANIKLGGGQCHGEFSDTVMRSSSFLLSSISLCSASSFLWLILVARGGTSGDAGSEDTNQNPRKKQALDRS